MFPAARNVLHRPSMGSMGLAATTLNSFSRSRFLATLAILEQRDGKLNHGSLNTFTAAKKVGGTVHGFIAGANVSVAAQEAAKVEGIEQVIKVENDAYEKVRN